MPGFSAFYDSFRRENENGMPTFDDADNRGRTGTGIPSDGGMDVLPSLSSSVGDFGRNDRKDVATVENMLGKTGDLDLKQTDGPTGYWGMRTSDATKAFQKKNKLKIDGQINPNGPTLQKLGEAMSVKFRQARTKGQLQPPRPSGEARDHVDRTHRGPRRGDNRQGNKIPNLTADAMSANGRAARYLASRRGIGDYATFVADGIETNPDQGIAEAADLIEQTRQQNPGQADELFRKTLDGLSDENAAKLRRELVSSPTDLFPDGFDPLDLDPSVEDTGEPIRLAMAGPTQLSVLPGLTAPSTDVPAHTSPFSPHLEASDDDVEEAMALRPLLKKTGAYLRDKLRRRKDGKQDDASDAQPVYRPANPDHVADAFKKALDTVNAGRALEGKKHKGGAEFTPDDIAPGTDEVEAIEGFVESWRQGKLLPDDQKQAQLNLGEVDVEFATRLKRDTGVDVTGFEHIIDTGQLRHAWQRHGPDRERNPNQEPLSPEAISVYKYAVEGYDTVYFRERRSGKITITFEKRVNGLVVVVEQVRTKTGRFAFHSMWIKRK